MDRKWIVAGAAALVLAGGGVGVAQAISGDGDESATGPDADRAKAAAVKAVGGGRAVEVERADDGESGWEVEVDRGNGSVVEVHLNSQFQKTGTEADDDHGGRDDD
jgi:uncharacterized membrane protein YkoI